MNNPYQYDRENLLGGNANVKVLIQGYARETPEGGWVASSTCCMVESAGKRIITDPGCNRELLLQALADEKLDPQQVDVVFLSHGHLDHILLAGIFSKASYVTFDDLMVYQGDSMHKLTSGVLGPGTAVIHTPGHVYEHLSLLVHTKEGITAIAGDVFWWKDDELQVVDTGRRDHSHPVGMEHGRLVQSRKLLLDLANTIIPGHGRIFHST